MDELDTGEFEMDGELLHLPSPPPALIVADEPGLLDLDDDLPLLDEGDFVFVGWTHDI